MLKADRLCPKCKEPRAWTKVRKEGAKASRRLCIVCGSVTQRIKGRRMKTVLPPGLYSYRQKVKIANELWRHLIYRKTPDGRCAVNPSHKGGLQAMHIFPKGKYPHLRFDISNGAPGCSGCHIRLTNDHEAHRDFSIQFLGAAEYERLRLRSISRCKMDIDLEILNLKRLTAEVEPQPGWS